MTKVEEDLEFAHALIEDKEVIVEYYWQFYRMWPFTTINMKAYLEPFNLVDKNCVTIQGSSDHVFELFLKKPKKIIGVDTNPLTEYYYYLKLAAFSVLDNSKDFLKFFRWKDFPQFCKNNSKVFDKDVFWEISNYLKGDSKIFWEDIFKKYDSIKIRENLFNVNDETNNRALYQALNYLSDENYEYIRNNAEKINFEFINTDIRFFSKQIVEKQDFITLSNLIIYSHCMWKDSQLQQFKELVNNLSQILNEDGNILVGYLYDIENESDFRDIYKRMVRDSVFSEDNYTYNYFKRMHDLHCMQESSNHDACLIYRNSCF